MLSSGVKWDWYTRSNILANLGKSGDWKEIQKFIEDSCNVVTNLCLFFHPVLGNKN